MSTQAPIRGKQLRLYEILRDAAEAGERCPTAFQLGLRIRTASTYIDVLLKVLEQRGWITVDSRPAGRVVTILATGKSTAPLADAAPAAAAVSDRPSASLEVGRYLLDADGRLHPLRYQGFIRAVATVNVLDYLKSERRAEEAIKRAIDEAISDGVLSNGPDAVTEILSCTLSPDGGTSPTGNSKRIEVSPPPRPAETLRSTGRRIPRVVPKDPDVEEPSEEDVAAFAEFTRNLERKRAERANGGGKKVVAEINGARLADALRRRPLRTPPAPKIPTRRALAPGECDSCGANLSRGCEHFLPYVAGQA